MRNDAKRQLNVKTKVIPNRKLAWKIQAIALNKKFENNSSSFQSDFLSMPILVFRLWPFGYEGI